MNHPEDEPGSIGSFGYGTDPDSGVSNVGTAGTAHTILSRLGLSF
jgi:hypothetical protein